MSYNGWSNKETWLVNLWFGDYFSDLANEGYDIDADHMQMCVEQHLDEVMSSQSGLIADFVNDAMSSVNWRELADHHRVEEEEDVEEDA